MREEPSSRKKLGAVKVVFARITDTFKLSVFGSTCVYPNPLGVRSNRSFPGGVRVSAIELCARELHRD